MRITPKQLDTLSDSVYLLEWYLKQFSDEFNNPDNFKDIQLMQAAFSVINELKTNA